MILHAIMLGSNKALNTLITLIPGPFYQLPDFRESHFHKTSITWVTKLRKFKVSLPQWYLTNPTLHENSFMKITCYSWFMLKDREIKYYFHSSSNWLQILYLMLLNSSLNSCNKMAVLVEKQRLKIWLYFCSSRGIIAKGIMAHIIVVAKPHLDTSCKCWALPVLKAKPSGQSCSV